MILLQYWGVSTRCIPLCRESESLWDYALGWTSNSTLKGYGPSVTQTLDIAQRVINDHSPDLVRLWRLDLPFRSFERTSEGDF